MLLQDSLAILAAQTMSQPDSIKAGGRQLMDTITSTPPQELMHMIVQDGLHFGLKVLAALALFLIGGWIIKLIKRAMNRGLVRRKAEPVIISFVGSLVSVTLWVLLIILTISTLGINTTSLAALLAAGGMAIGMALSGTVQNFAGGIMLLVFKPFKSGDMIEAQGHTGKVTEINIISTKIITPDNRIIILPNGALSNGNINNITALPIRRVETSVTVSYGADADAVRTAILDILKADPRILEDFSSIMDDTSDRNDFTSRNNEYVKTLMDAFGPEGMDVMLIYYDKQKDMALEAERQKRRAALEASLETAPEKKLRGIREEIESIDKQHEHFDERIRETEGMGDRVAVAGGVTSNYGGMRSCLFGGARNL
ncbi:MAG: peptidoglycan bridge formation glycyltransferase FemA/FemB family protein, partial [Bacteroidales bacterium]|nr:peptidoglycan bridge formation glycyltransferase FemA/FemB family protein [Bacteroidales bacterium]